MTIPKWNQTETTLSSDRLSMSSAGDTEYYIDVQRDVVRRIRFHQSAAVYVTLQQLIEQDYLPSSAYHYEEDGMGGFDVEIFENIEQLIWEKLLCNVTLSGPCTAFDVNVADLLKTDAQWKIALGAMTEAYQLGLAKGIPFSFDDPVPFVTDFARRVGTAKPSMLQDHQAQRRSEIHAINGAIARLGRKMGYETPYNTTLSEIILAHEAKFKD